MDNLTKLKKHFKEKHNIDYFTECEIFKFIDMAYCMGQESNESEESKQENKYYKQLNMTNIIYK